MVQLFVNGSERTDYLVDGSLRIVDQVQNKANTATFGLNPGVTKPEENQEVLVYDTVELVSASGTDIVIEDNLASGLSVLPQADLRPSNDLYGQSRGKFRAGQTFWLGIGTANEEKITIASIAEDTTAGRVAITATESITNSHSAGEDCGRLVFGGVILNVTTKNPKLLTDVEYTVSCTDFTKIFDKQLVNDSWQSADARYIINDFCNTTINYNAQLDDMDYADNTAVQSAWNDSGTANNPTVNTTEVLQGTNAVNFPWTTGAGNSRWTNNISSVDLSDFVGATSGSPTEGNLTLWVRTADISTFSSIIILVGSSAVNSAEFTLDPPDQNDEYQFYSLKFTDATINGTPDWTAVDFVRIEVTDTADGTVIIDDLRVTAEGSFTLYNVLESLPFDDARASFKKPTVFIDRLAKTLSYYWYIDYERDIHFISRENEPAPFEITDTSDNFDKLRVDVDTRQLKNRQAVRGGTDQSANTYTQVFEGDNAVREWILKSKFANLTILIDNNSSTDLMEGGTTTTTVVATGHGLSDGDYIVNRTRNNAVRQITYVDPNTFTVEAVASQASGDTFSLFSVSKTVGLENLVDETTVDYVSNYTEKSVRATDSEATLTSGEFILFEYNEVIKIRTQVLDPVSIASMKSLLGGNGIFDGAPITDASIDSLQAARDRAQAEVDQYSNPIVKITFDTDFEGLESGQLLSVTDSNKGIADDYMIQKVAIHYKTSDYPVFRVTAASTLFGIIEYFQKLSESIGDFTVDEDEVIDQIVSESQIITISESNTVNTPAESASESETITITPSETATERDISVSPYVWQPDASDSRWNLAQWG